MKTMQNSKCSKKVFANEVYIYQCVFRVTLDVKCEWKLLFVYKKTQENLHVQLLDH